MYNHLMAEKEINVKVGDRVSVQGNEGIVTKVIRTSDTEWNGSEYVVVPDTESTTVRVHFTGALAEWGQYQDGNYGGYTVIESRDYTPEYQRFYEEVATAAEKASKEKTSDLYDVYCKEPSWFDEIIYELWGREEVFA